MVNLQELWEKWQLKVLVLGSLTLQVILFLLGSSRKRSSRKLIISLLWLTYLSADWAATFALGTMSNTLRCSSPSSVRIDIMALWTPFLLLHMGGPDTITAFSLEDNQLWLRHAMTLLLQTIAAVHIFIRSVPRSNLISPAALIFLAGILKYGERTWALKNGSMKALRGFLNRAGNNVAQQNRVFVSEFSTCHNNHRQLSQASACFKILTRLFLDQMLGDNEARAIKSVSMRSKPYEAFQVLEIELSFAYDILYTKALVVHSLSGLLLRAACFCSEIAAFFLFLGTEKNGYHKVDVAVTYTLIISALALEIVALGSLIFSDWTIVKLVGDPYDFRESGCLKRSFCEVLRISRPPCQKHRWSNCIGQYSFLGYCIKNCRPIAWFDKLLTSFGMKEMWNEVRNIEYVEIKDGLKSIIFYHLKGKSNWIGTSSERRQAYIRNRGGWALEGCRSSRVSRSTEGAFDESILVWHIATDICFHRDDNTGRERPECEDHLRVWSKNLSRYLLYLLLVRPAAMSSTSGLAALRYERASQKAMGIFNDFNIGDESKAAEMLLISELYPRVTYYSNEWPREVQSVLEDGVELARALLRYPKREIWTIVSEVLVEMLCFAARHCKGNYHAQMLSSGGELVTFIWFLEAHLGLIETLPKKNLGLIESYDDNLTTPVVPEKTESSAQPNETSPLLSEL